VAKLSTPERPRLTESFPATWPSGASCEGESLALWKIWFAAVSFIFWFISISSTSWPPSLALTWPRFKYLCRSNEVPRSADACSVFLFLDRICRPARCCCVFWTPIKSIRGTACARITTGIGARGASSSFSQSETSICKSEFRKSLTSWKCEGPFFVSLHPRYSSEAFTSGDWVTSTYSFDELSLEPICLALVVMEGWCFSVVTAASFVCLRIGLCAGLKHTSAVHSSVPESRFLSRYCSSDEVHFESDFVPCHRQGMRLSESFAPSSFNFTDGSPHDRKAACSAADKSVNFRKSECV